MKAIMLLFDSLNRHMLPGYGCEWTHAPNFRRLQEQSITFDHSWVGSMPCMPARRDLLTGRYNFLHRSWGPVEPYDETFPELLKNKGVYSHLVTDHQHYWEDGGSTYHNRYSSYEFIRGQEGDLWKGEVADPETPSYLGGHSGLPHLVRQDWINRKYICEEAQFPLAQTIQNGIEFIRTNHKQDNWFLQIEAFDPHEPFYAPQVYRDLYPHNYDGPHFDWPPYERVSQTPEQAQHCRYQYAALLSMCDNYLGRLLDEMDRLQLWDDTMLIVCTDHGFLLGEHGWWAKCVQPFYNEVARTPLFIWDPRFKKSGERRSGLVQLIDMAPTLLEFFGMEPGSNMTGKSLVPAIAGDGKIHDAVLFGIHGGHVNLTDGRFVYMRAPATADNKPLYNYTLIPTHMRSFLGLDELRQAELSTPFSFSQGLQLLKVPSRGSWKVQNLETMLFDLQIDPGQKAQSFNSEAENRLADEMIRLMTVHDAPPEQYERLQL